MYSSLGKDDAVYSVQGIRSADLNDRRLFFLDQGYMNEWAFVKGTSRFLCHTGSWQTSALGTFPGPNSAPCNCLRTFKSHKNIFTL